METIVISYHFKFTDGRQEVFDVRLDGTTLDLLREPADAIPPWTRLDIHRCPNCSLDQPRCPAALALAPLVTSCCDIRSFDVVDICMATAGRSITKTTTAQRGVSSLMGLLMATSGCPQTRFLRPMARFHLPFANAEETICRAVSMYLLGQYFEHKAGRPADLDLEGLKRRYEELNAVNYALSLRLREASRRDSAVNALVLLDHFALEVPRAIEESLENIRYLFDGLAA
jgi:hypothetical protein